MYRGSSIGQLAGLSNPAVQSATPTVGQTVNVVGSVINNVLLALTPAGTLATLTVALPNDASSFIGQVVRVSTSAAVTLLTVNGAASILNAPAALLAGANIGFQKTAADTWQRMQ